MFVWGLGVESANPMSAVFFTAKSHRGSAARNRSPLLLVLKPHFFWMGDQHGKQDRLWSKTQASELCATRWCPSSLAKLVQITPIMGFINQLITEGHHIVVSTSRWVAASVEDLGFVLPADSVGEYFPQKQFFISPELMELYKVSIFPQDSRHDLSFYHISNIRRTIHSYIAITTINPSYCSSKPNSYLGGPTL